jgi:hypothetical protein
MNSKQEHIDRLFAAELQFRLASAVRLALSTGHQPLDLPITWVHGKHAVEYKEVALREDQADFAADVLQRSATWVMAVVIRDALVSVISDPKNDPNPNIRSAYQISRMIRNSFAHGPINPKWSIDSDCENQEFSVEDIITLNTKNLQGVPFDWRHYGGPLALLRLCQFVRFEILGDTGKKPSDRTVDDPKIKYYQQGNLIIERLEE